MNIAVQILFPFKSTKLIQRYSSEKVGTKRFKEMFS